MHCCKKIKQNERDNAVLSALVHHFHHLAHRLQFLNIFREDKKVLSVYDNPCHQTLSNVISFTAHCTVHTTDYRLYTLHITLLTSHFTLNTLLFILYILHVTLYTLYFTLCTLHCTLHTVHPWAGLTTLHCTGPSTLSSSAIRTLCHICAA